MFKLPYEYYFQGLLKRQSCRESSLPKRPQWPLLSPAQARSLELHPRFPHGLQEPGQLSIFCCFPWSISRKLCVVSGAVRTPLTFLTPTLWIFVSILTLVFLLCLDVPLFFIPSLFKIFMCINCVQSDLNWTNVYKGTLKACEKWIKS